MVRAEIRKAKELTDKPFGVNVMLLSPHAEDVAKVVVEEGIKVVTTGAGNPEKLAAFCAQRGIGFDRIDVIELDGAPVSSTRIRALLEAGDMAEAVRCLGHPHVLTGPVVSGRHLGRTIGIPTANLALPPQLLCPRHGVYAALACFDGRRLPAVVNIGSRPTVGGTHVTVEPWILDFDGDLYGRTLRLEFYTFLRPERKFDSLDELRDAIVHNAEQTREFFRDR